MALSVVDRRIIRLAIPALGALAVEPLYVVVDTAIVGTLGTPPLAGLGIAAAVLSIVFAGSNFLTYGTTERVARRIGAGDLVGAANVGVQTMWLSLAVGVVAALAVGAGAKWWIGLMGAGPAAAPHAETYLRISSLGVPAILITLGAQGVLRGGSDYVRPMWVLLSTNLLNVVIELLFVYGFDWGVAGSAWSTVIAQTVGAVVLLFLVRTRLSAATHRTPSAAAMAPLMSAGWFLILRVGSMLVVLTGATSLAARRSAVDAAAHSIVTSLFLLTGLVLDSLAMPAQTMVAEALGGADGPSPRHIANRVARLSILGGVTIAGLLALGSGSVGKVFSDDADVIMTAQVGVIWLAVGVVPGSVAFAYDGVLIGAADYRFLGLAALATTVTLAPFGIGLGVASGGLGAIWAVLALWFVMRAASTWWRAACSTVLTM